MSKMCRIGLSIAGGQSQILFNCPVEDLSGKGLARYLFPTRFQPLPIRTAREVFPQAAHPVNFSKRFMGLVKMGATFTDILPRFLGDGFSNPSKDPEHRRDTRYSIAAIRRYAFVSVFFSLARFEFSSLCNRVLH